MHIKEFHKRYVLVPADKASNNIIVVCKKYYIDMIVNELMNASQPSTYNVHKYSNSEQLIRKHLVDMDMHNERALVAQST